VTDRGEVASRAGVVVAVAVALLVVACSSSKSGGTTTTAATTVAPPPSTAPAAAAKFTFGFVAPTTPLLLDLAYAQENALALAVSDINAGGGVLGAPVKAITTDDKTAGSVPDAVTSLVKGGANAVLGPVSSTDAKAAVPAVAGAKTLACSGSATAPDLNPAPPKAAFFRTVLPDQYTVDFVSNQIVALRDAHAPGQPWKVTIVARADDYGLSVSGGLASVLTAEGITASVVT
jgi:branched-chain amino acid transport system substrate-binding protein